MEIVFVRHGQSEGNAAGVWQGHTNSPLNSVGREQAAALRRRLDGRPYDLVVSSDLDRARDTAEALGQPVESDSMWRELDLGEWEGLTREEVAERYPDQLAGLRNGEPVRFGGGESLPEFDARIEEALAKLTGRLDDGDRVAVFTHGGAIASLVRSTLGIRGFAAGLGRIENTSVTRIRVAPGRRLETYNDSTHLDPFGGWARQRHEEGDTLLTLIRHGETDGNVGDRWQGITEGQLTVGGARQAQALAHWYGGLDTLYASPALRAQDTATALAEVLGLDVVEHEGVTEMHMGEWEDLTTAEIQAGWAELWEQIYDRHEDLPRGRSGEALAETAGRMQAALEELSRRHAGARVGVVSHGGAIHAYALDLLGLEQRAHDRLAFVDNTSVTHVVIGAEGTFLADYNVAPHLEP